MVSAETSLHPPFDIGPIRVDPPVLLAPMEDVTSQAFRRIVKRIGAPGLMFTEFVSAMAIHYGAQKTFRKMAIHAEERPLAIQIFGPDPEVMAETAQVAEELGADLIDINMGCWVPKVCKTGAGAALLKDPDLAEAIVARVVGSVKVPVTVKVRAGWEFGLFAAPELAKRFEGAGARMITLHARFAKQGFDGEADWGLLEEMRKAVSVPLVGNGDVKSPEDTLSMFTRTGCDGVMIGRAAISNPWLVARVVAKVKGEESPIGPTISERIDVALEHLRLAIEFETTHGSNSAAEAEQRATRSLRGQLPLYIKGEPGASGIRDRLTRCSSYDEVAAILDAFRTSSLGHLASTMP